MCSPAPPPSPDARAAPAGNRRRSAASGLKGKDHHLKLAVPAAHAPKHPKRARMRGRTAAD